MIVGAGPYSRGLTVRWYRFSDSMCALYAPRVRRYLAICEGSAPHGHVVRVQANRLKLINGPHDHRWQAKRTAELLVGQWWREKCWQKTFKPSDAVAHSFIFAGQEPGGKLYGQAVADVERGSDPC